MIESLDRWLYHWS